MNDIFKLVESLSEGNYPVWGVRMRALLVRKGLWEATDPEFEYDSPTVRSKSETALALNSLAQGEYQMVHVEGITSARDAWKKVKSIFAETSNDNRMRLYESIDTSTVWPCRRA